MMAQLLLIGPFGGEAEKISMGLKEKYPVFEAKTAQEGYHLFQQEKNKHLLTVILDMYVEDEDGFDVIESLKSIDALPEIIAIAPDMRVEWAIDAMKVGAYRFECYEVALDTLDHYIAQIEGQLDLVALAMKYSKLQDLAEIDLRKNLVQEFLHKRRQEGRVLSAQEVLVFYAGEDQAVFLGEASSKVPLCLVVEDEADLSRSIGDFLSTLQYDFKVASSKAEALNLLETYSFDLVLLDIGLPDGRGGDLIMPSKAQDPFVQVIMLTAYKDIETISQSFKYGAADYIPKPFDMGYFQTIVRKAVQRRALSVFVPNKKQEGAVDSLTKLQLLMELVQMRALANRPIQLREIACFVGVQSKYQEVAPAQLQQGLVAFLLSQAVHLTEEERVALEVLEG